MNLILGNVSFGESKFCTHSLQTDHRAYIPKICAEPNNCLANLAYQFDPGPGAVCVEDLYQ